MIRRGLVGLTVALVIASSGVAFAQGGGGQGGGGQGGGRRGQGFGMRGGMMGGGGLQLLRVAEVQKELKMTPEQIAKVGDKQQEVGQSMRSMMQGGFQDMTPAERQAMMTKMQNVQTKAVGEILDATQMKRFHELELQQAGPNALARPDVQTELKLTDDQKQKIADIQSESQQAMRAAMQGGGNPQDMTAADRTQMRTRMEAAQKASTDKMAAVLTPAQQAQWKTMLGASFKFPENMGRGRQGGGRQGGGRQRQGGGAPATPGQ